MVKNFEARQIAQRYAKALLLNGIENNTLDCVKSDITALSDTLSASHDLSRIISNPLFSNTIVSNVLNDITKALQSGKEVQGLLSVLIENNRTYILSVVLDVFQELLDSYNGIIKANVICASELSDSQKASVNDAVSKAIGSNVVVQHSVDASILGGLIIRYGSVMFDASIQAKLEKLQLEMKGA